MTDKFSMKLKLKIMYWFKIIFEKYKLILKMFSFPIQSTLTKSVSDP